MTLIPNWMVVSDIYHVSFEGFVTSSSEIRCIWSEHWECWKLRYDRSMIKYHTYMKNFFDLFFRHIMNFFTFSKLNFLNGPKTEWVLVSKVPLPIPKVNNSSSLGYRLIPGHQLWWEESTRLWCRHKILTISCGLLWPRVWVKLLIQSGSYHFSTIWPCFLDFRRLNSAISVLIVSPSPW